MNDILNKMTEKQRALVLDLANDFKPLVKDIEARPATTQNHYGDYLALLGRLNAMGDKSNLLITVFALQLAGANREGLIAAYKLSI